MNWGFWGNQVSLEQEGEKIEGLRLDKEHVSGRGGLSSPLNLELLIIASGKILRANLRFSIYILKTSFQFSCTICAISLSFELSK